MLSCCLVRFGEALETRRSEVPVPTGTEVLLKVKACGVCHSDLHLREGGYDLGGGKRLSFAERGLKLPLTPGHEVVGEVVGLGEGLAEGAGAVPLGALRLAFPWIGCGQCPVCQRGDEHMCPKPQSLGVYRPGGYSEYVLVPHPKYLFDIDRLSPVEAAPYACAGLTAYSALKKLSRHSASGPLLIIGAGGLGLMSLTLLRAMGGQGAVVTDIAEKNLAAAALAGALATVPAGQEDTAARITEACGGAVQGVVDFVCSPDTARLGIDLLARGGKYVAVGLFGGEISLSLPLIPVRAISIEGSYVGSLAEMAELMDLVRDGSQPRLAVSTRPLAEADATLDALARRELVGRAVLLP